MGRNLRGARRDQKAHQLASRLSTVRPQPTKGAVMFTFKLIHTDGTPAEPPQFVTAVPNWQEGDTFLLRPGRVLRIVSIRCTDEQTVWTIERVT